ncbi:MAG: response regulator [Dehalococcoidales bacterium]|nr:response regulator [Dehalococcoidales bacterium]MDZ4230802.1 response regulator [Dehalococcoidales bacterium]
MENKRILLVEDNPKDVELTKRALLQSNISNGLMVVEDGVEALKYFFGEDGKSGCAFEDLPVVVLLDLKLPRVDGLEVLRRLRASEKTKLMPVVVLTSSNEEKDIVASYDLGANSFVRKPVKFSEFAEAIRHLGLYWLILNQPAPNGARK